MKKINEIFSLVLFFSLLFPLSAYPQQTKRNLIANSQFEEGLKNWRKKTANNVNAEYGLEEITPISGSKSAKLKLSVLGSTDDIRNARLAYNLPIEKGAKYKIILKVRADRDAVLGIEFAQNYGAFEPLPIPRPLPSGFLGEGRFLRGTIDVTTTVKEYTFTTNAITNNDWNYTFGFNFGSNKQLGVTFYIDDIKIARADDGDWTGNLFPLGDFEDAAPQTITSGPIEDYSMKIHSPLMSFDERAKGEYTKSENLLTYDIPAEFPFESSPLFNVSVDGRYTGVYNDKNAWGKFVSFGYFDFNPDHEVTVEVTSAKAFGTYQILPEINNIQSERSGNTIRFKTKDADKAITIVFDNDYKGNTFHLFANSIDKDAPTASTDDLIYFGRGYHNLNGALAVTGNKKVYIAGGAVVDGNLRVENGTGVSIKGRGMLMRRVAEGLVLSASFSKNTTIDGILIHNHRNPGWTVAFHVVSGMTVTNVNVVSTRYASTDGFDIVNSNNITLKNVFVRACDDAIAVKGLIEGKPENCPPNENMLFEDMQIWNDCNNAMCLGAETRAAYYKNIKFKNIDVLHSYDDRDHHEKLDERSVMSIVCLEGTFFSDISYEDIRVNRCERLICLTFKDSFWFGTLLGDQSTEGGISGISYKNITSSSNSGSSIANDILLNGWYKTGTPTKLVQGITFNNVVVEGNLVNSKDDPNIKTNNSERRTLVKDLYFNTEPIRNIPVQQRKANSTSSLQSTTVTGTWSIDGNNSLGSGKSLFVNKMGESTETDFWNFALSIPYWTNENAETEVSFNVKSGDKDAKLDVLVINDRDKFDRGKSLFIGNPEISSEQKKVVLDKSNSVISPQVPNSGEYASEDEGKQHLYISFADIGLTPIGLNCWIDDVSVKESNLMLEDFEVLGLPENSLTLNQAIQLSIGEFVTPTHAPTRVIYAVENQTGEASLNSAGLLTPTKLGSAILKVSNPESTVEKIYPIRITLDGSSIEKENIETIAVSPNKLKAGEVVFVNGAINEDYMITIYSAQGKLVFEAKNSNEINTSGWTSGVYILKGKTLNKNLLSAKLIIE